jgi:hypothetical protein
VIKLRRLGVAFAALALAALAVSPALAATINQEQVPTTAAEWTAANPAKSAAECTGDNVPAEGLARWHFVLTGAATGQTITLTAYFTDANDVPQAPLQDVGEEADSSGTYHFYINTPDDWILVNATTNESGTSGNLNLSHVCLGTPGEIVPEAPASALLVLTAGVLGLFFILRRRSITSTATPA